mgnify:CR=1 FL=1
MNSDGLYKEYLNFETSLSVIGRKNREEVKKIVDQITVLDFNSDALQNTCDLSSTEALILFENLRYYTSESFIKDSLESLANKQSLEIRSPLGDGLSKTNHSVTTGSRNSLRFSGGEVFYLFQDNFFFEGLFFPERKLFVSATLLNPQKKLQEFIYQLILHSNAYINYFSMKPYFGGVRVSHPSPYHYLYFQLPVLDIYSSILSKMLTVVWVEPNGNYIDLKVVFGDVVGNVYEMGSLDKDKKNIETQNSVFLVALGMRQQWVDRDISKQIDNRIVTWSKSAISVNEKV